MVLDVEELDKLGVRCAGWHYRINKCILYVRADTRNDLFCLEMLALGEVRGKFPLRAGQSRILRKEMQ